MAKNTVSLLCLHIQNIHLCYPENVIYIKYVCDELYAQLTMICNQHGITWNIIVYEVCGSVHVVAHDNQLFTHNVMMSQWRGKPPHTTDCRSITWWCKTSLISISLGIVSYGKWIATTMESPYQWVEYINVTNWGGGEVSLINKVDSNDHGEPL